MYKKVQTTGQRVSRHIGRVAAVRCHATTDPIEMDAVVPQRRGDGRRRDIRRIALGIKNINECCRKIAQRDGFYFFFKTKQKFNTTRTK